ncbi:MAG: FAD-dependent oxidoreductase [bacterium]|nr:FAD-dependent oxidoreductase [bacterium]
MASVLVIGAGLAGLGCAWRLTRAGFDVEVLERHERPGGRLACERKGEALIEPGTGFFTSHDRSLHSVANHLGLGTSVQSVLRYPDAIETERGFRALRPVEDPLLLRSRAVSRRASLRLLRLQFEWLRWRHKLDPPDPEVVAGLDSRDLASYFDRLVGRELRTQLVVPYVSGLLGFDAEQLSAAYLLRLVDRVRGARPQYLAGGMDQLTSRLAERLCVRYGCEVTSLESEEEGARARYRAGSREGTAMADAVVVAVPGTRVAELCPKLAPAERGFFEGLRYAPSTVVHLLLDEAPNVPHRCVVFPRRDGFALCAVNVAHHKRGAAPAGTGLLRVSLTQAAGDRVWEASAAEVGGLVLDNLESTPFGKLSPREITVHRERDAAPIFGPGLLASLERFANRAERSARMAFCGDYRVGNGAEAALVSGMRAASQIAHSLPANA